MQGKHDTVHTDDELKGEEGARAKNVIPKPCWYGGQGCGDCPEQDTRLLKVSRDSEASTSSSPSLATLAITIRSTASYSRKHASQCTPPTVLHAANVANNPQTEFVNWLIINSAHSSMDAPEICSSFRRVWQNNATNLTGCTNQQCAGICKHKQGRLIQLEIWITL